MSTPFAGPWTTRTLPPAPHWPAWLLHVVLPNQCTYKIRSWCCTILQFAHAKLQAATSAAHSQELSPSDKVMSYLRFSTLECVLISLISDATHAKSFKWDDTSAVRDFCANLLIPFAQTGKSQPAGRYVASFKKEKLLDRTEQIFICCLFLVKLASVRSEKTSQFEIAHPRSQVTSSRPHSPMQSYRPLGHK